MTRDFKVGILFGSESGGSVSSFGATGRITLSCLLRGSSFMDYRYPLAGRARGVVGGRGLGGVGGDTCLVGASENPIISRRTLTSTLGDNRVTNTTLSILGTRPTGPTGPLLSTRGYVVAPRVT